MYFSHHFFFPDVSNYFHVSGGGRYDTILELCGELCDLSKPVKDQENVVGYITAQVNIHRNGRQSVCQKSMLALIAHLKKVENGGSLEPINLRPCM